MKKPQLIEIEKIGNPNLGYISVLQNHENVPFEIKRVYWTYLTPDNIERGDHAHRQLEQIIISLNGTIKFYLEEIDGTTSEYILSEPNQCLYLPPFIWRKIKFEENSVLLCLASEIYNPEEYIRNYSEFEQIKLNFSSKK
jgi:hypothetical protein